MDLPADPLSLQRLVKHVYESQLTKLDQDESIDIAIKNEEKVKILLKCLHEAEEQSDLLLGTVVELEQEVAQRVLQMEKRLKSSAKSTKETCLNLQNYELEMKRLIKERFEMESALWNMQQQVSATVVENNFLRDQNMNLNHDIQSLLHIIQQARFTGHWEVDCVTFCEVTPEQVFGPVQSLMNMSSPASSSPVPCHAAKNGTISKNSRRENGDYLKCPLNRDKEATRSLVESGARQSYEPINIRTNEPALRRSLSMPERHCLSNLNYMHHRQKLSQSCSISKKNCDPLKGRRSALKNFGTNEKSAGSTSTMHLSSGSNPIRHVYSEPHLFMLGDSIYAYKPCEPLHRVTSSGCQVDEDPVGTLFACQSAELKLSSSEQMFTNRRPMKWDRFNNVSSQGEMMEIYPCSSASHSTDFSCPSVNGVDSTPATPLRTNWKRCCHMNVKKQISCHAQTEPMKSTTIGLQADFDNVDANSEAIALKKIEDFDLKDVKKLKECLLRADDKVAAQAVLLQELQNHLSSAATEVRWKDTVLENIEKKLEAARSECRDLRVETSIHEDCCKLLTKQLEEAKDVNNNLVSDLIAKDAIIEDWRLKEKNWQQQKRTLMTQLDAQGDELEVIKNELLTTKRNLEASLVQMDQQSNIIKSLQEALVQSKRDFDKVRPIVPPAFTNGILQSQSTHSSRSSIQDL